MTFFRCLCLLLILCCCNSKPKTDGGTIRVSVLRGPSAIAFAHWMEETPVVDDKPLSVQIIDSPDLMQAALIKGEADIAVLPMISAANLYNKGIRYHLAGCPIWGTLYLVGRNDKGISGENKPVLHIFGAGTTPDILTRHYLRQHNTGYTLNYSFTIRTGDHAGAVGRKSRPCRFRRAVLEHCVAERQHTANTGRSEQARFSLFWICPDCHTLCTRLKKESKSR